MGQIRAYYDDYAARQDTQGYYEDGPLAWLLARSGFEEAGVVVEFGCGTGRFALQLMAQSMPAGSRYLGFDLSPVMLSLAMRRLLPFRDRVLLVQNFGETNLPVSSNSVDRLVANYVLDILPTTAIRNWLLEAGRILKPEGRLCVANLTWGPSPMSWLVSLVWAVTARLRPLRVGGCRPMNLAKVLCDGGWRILKEKKLVASGIASQALVARPPG